MDANEILTAIAIGAFVLIVGMFISYAYYAGVDYNECVKNSQTAEIASLCKLTR